MIHKSPQKEETGQREVGSGLARCDPFRVVTNFWVDVPRVAWATLGCLMPALSGWVFGLGSVRFCDPG